MLVLAGALLLALVQQQTPTRTTVVVGGSATGVSVQRRPQDSAGAAQWDSARRARKRIPVTDEHRRTAFRDAGAKPLLEKARIARMSQDSSLRGYDATTYQRISVGMGVGRVGRERLAFRTENASRVRWQRGVGAYVDLEGARTALPILRGIKDAEEEASADIDGDEGMSPIPYYPGYDGLWIGGSVARADVDPTQIIHPLANGAEAYYQYESGDSVSFRLPDGRVVRLRELRVRPRTPTWNLAVGSLWFDASSGQLVRAAFRLAEPMDIWKVASEEEDEDPREDVPALVRPMLSPMKGQMSAIAIEYGLHQGRFWLPRLQVAEGDGQIGFMRAGFRMEQRFQYTSVNGDTPLPPIPPELLQGPPRIDTTAWTPDRRAAFRDSVRAAVAARRDSSRRGLKRPDACSTNPDSVRTRYHRRYGAARVPVAMRIPCDTVKLRTSPLLPKSIYTEDEETWGSGELQKLVEDALALGAQPAWSPQPPVVRYGLEFTRYNRVEGLSLGAAVDMSLGKGYSAAALGRLGIADLEPNLELAMQRSNLRQTWRLGAYNRLASVNDWGAPLSFGASVSALLWGRDEGFYFRQSGLELLRKRETGTPLELRLFAEQQRAARAETDFSFARVMRGARFPSDVEAARGEWVGTGLRYLPQYGKDPLGFRFMGDLRLEGATRLGDRLRYGRAALDATLSRGIGPAAAALTIAGGSSVGTVPAQRQWYLGGLRTVRGLAPGTARGDAFWMTRLELGTSTVAWRPVVFYDAGWAGERRSWREVGRPLQGAGVGASFLDGLVRFDVARGIAPTRQWRVDLSLESRF